MYRLMSLLVQLICSVYSGCSVNCVHLRRSEFICSTITKTVLLSQRQFVDVMFPSRFIITETIICASVCSYLASSTLILTRWVTATAGKS